MLHLPLIYSSRYTSTLLVAFRPATCCLTLTYDAVCRRGNGRRNTYLPTLDDDTWFDAWVQTNGGCGGSRTHLDADPTAPQTPVPPKTESPPHHSVARSPNNSIARASPLLPPHRWRRRAEATSPPIRRRRSLLPAAEPHCR